MVELWCGPCDLLRETCMMSVQKLTGQWQIGGNAVPEVYLVRVTGDGGIRV